MNRPEGRDRYTRPPRTHNQRRRRDDWASDYSTRSRTRSRPRRKLYRSRNRLLGGVCGGLADYLGFDRWMVRAVAFVLFLIYTIPVAIVYIILCLVLDVAPRRAYVSDRDDADVFMEFRRNPGRAFRHVGSRMRALERKIRNMERRDRRREEDLERAFDDL